MNERIEEGPCLPDRTARLQVDFDGMDLGSCLDLALRPQRCDRDRKANETLDVLKLFFKSILQSFWTKLPKY